MTAFLDFEKQVAALDRQIAELRDMGDDPSLNIDKDIARLWAKSAKMLRDIYARLTPWRTTRDARHPDRPHFKHYVTGLFDSWMPLARASTCGTDQSIQGGLPRVRGRRVSGGVLEQQRERQCPSGGQGRENAAVYLCQAGAVAKDAGRAPSRPAAFQTLCGGAVRRLDAAGRRPKFRRRSGDPGRPCAFSRPPGDGDRARKRRRYPVAHEA